MTKKSNLENPDSAFHKLVGKQARFVDEYMKDSNGRQAAKRAGYAESSWGVIASKNLQNPVVRMAIAELRQDIAERNRITVDDLIKELEEARCAGLSANIAQASAAVSATMGKAKMLGFLTDHVDHTSGGEKIEAGLGHFYGKTKLKEDDMYDSDED